MPDDDRLPPAILARRVMRAADRAALATIDADGGPFASLVLVACDQAATPILLMSGLARHTRNLHADARASLLFDGTAGHAEPLEGPRVTLTGRIGRTGDPRHRDRYLARHPSARDYAGFGDFGFYALRVDEAYLVAGFGRIDRIAAAELAVAAAAAAALAGAEPDLLARLNAGGLADRLASSHADRAGGGWLATGIDCDGIDLRNAGGWLRLPFARPATGPQDAEALLRLAAG